MRVFLLGSCSDSWCKDRGIYICDVLVSQHFASFHGLKNEAYTLGRGLNLRPPAQQTGTYPIELIGRRSVSVLVSRVACLFRRTLVPFHVFSVVVLTRDFKRASLELGPGGLRALITSYATYAREN